MVFCVWQSRMACHQCWRWHPHPTGWYLRGSVMLQESTVLDCADFLVELQELREQSRHLREACRSRREASCALGVEAQQVKSPWPLAMPEEPVPQKDDTRPNPTPYDQAMETLRAMRAMLDTSPLEWQGAVVKAITARTLLKAHERTRPAQSALSA